MLDDENLFSYPYFHVTHQDPTRYSSTAKFLKLYVLVVRVVNSVLNLVLEYIIIYISAEVRN
jgi:hypothetical protein